MHHLEEFHYDYKQKRALETRTAKIDGSQIVSFSIAQTHMGILALRTGCANVPALDSTVLIS